MQGFGVQHLSPGPIQPAAERWTTKDDHSHPSQYVCSALFSKWGVNASSAGFYTCCASFILPWDRVLWYPRGFYEEALQLALQPDDHERRRAMRCFEWVVYAWYQEPALTPGMKRAYLAAIHEGQQYNLSTCDAPQPPSC